MKKEIKTFKELATFINPNRIYGEEGVDYININVYSKSRLGKMLAPEYVNKVRTPSGAEHFRKIKTPFGSFLSVSNYWMWLNGGQDDRIRFIHPKNLKKAIREENLNVSSGRRKLTYFKELIAHAKFSQLDNPYTRNFLSQNEDELKKMITMFIEKEGFRTTLPHADWYVKHCRQVIDAIMSGEGLGYDIQEMVKVTADELGFVNFGQNGAFEEADDEEDIDQQLMKELSKDNAAEEAVETVEEVATEEAA